MKSTVLLTVLLAGCPAPPTVSGVVTDVFGGPVEGATVMMEGQTENMITDAQGSFTFPMKTEPMKIVAGKQGFIKGRTVVVPPAEKGDPVPGASISLYPEPAANGFHALGGSGYLTLAGREITVMASELKGLSGVKETGEAIVSGSPAKVMFSTDLKPHELARLELQLHKLDYVEDIEIKGVLGKEKVSAHLWVAKDPVEFELEQMSTGDDFLITTKPLEAGVYAFHTQAMLTRADVAALDKLPKEQRVAYTFEVK